jgi:hypothetical protein
VLRAVGFVNCSRGTWAREELRELRRELLHREPPLAAASPQGAKALAFMGCSKHEYEQYVELVQGATLSGKGEASPRAASRKTTAIHRKARALAVRADAAAAAGGWTSAYNRACESLQRELAALRLVLGTRVGGDTGRASVHKDGNQIASVDDFEVVRTLGKGAFGEVFLASRKKELYAVKVLRRSALKRMRQGRTGSALDNLKTEIATMKKIGHPNCVQMFDVILDPEQDEVCARHRHNMPLVCLSVIISVIISVMPRGPLRDGT